MKYSPLKPGYPRFEKDRFGTTTPRWADISKEIGVSTDYVYTLKKDIAEKPQKLIIKDGMTKRLVVNPELCTGCQSCEMACSFKHEKLYSPTLARLHVVKLEESGIDFPIIC